MILINFQISSLMLLSIMDASVWVVWEYCPAIIILFLLHSSKIGSYLLYILFTHCFPIMDISKQQCIEELDFTRIYAHVSDDEVQQGFLQ